MQRKKKIAMKLIADSGSTKTDWAAIAPNGTIVGTQKSDGINPIHQSPDDIKAVLNQLMPKIWSIRTLIS